MLSKHVPEELRKGSLSWDHSWRGPGVFSEQGEQNSFGTSEKSPEADASFCR